MKVRVTFDFSAEDRRALASHYGDESLPDYAAMKRYVEAAVNDELETIIHRMEVRDRYLAEGFTPHEAEGMVERL